MRRAVRRWCCRLGWHGWIPYPTVNGRSQLWCRHCGRWFTEGRA
jgi:hypothetical protein